MTRYKYMILVILTGLNRALIGTTGHCAIGEHILKAK
jgi:hypothetical protein